MRVLFVGATGVIGRRVVPLLAPQFDLKLAAREAGDVGGLPVVAADIADFAQTVALMEGVDAVVNAAIESPIRPDGRSRSASEEEYRDYNEGQVEVNLRGAYHLYEAAARAGVRRFVFISSLTVQLGLPTHERITADSELRPREFYACTKVFGEYLGRVYATTRDMRVLCLRLGQPYPIDHPQEETWQADPRTRGLLVAIPDIAAAIGGALRAEGPPFGAYPIASTSDTQWIDLEPGREIGYAPRYHFTAEGMEAHTP